MNAGKELDALVYVKVMGFELMTFERTQGQEPYPPTGVGFKIVPRYSTEIIAAWQIVDKLAPSLKLELVPTSEGYQASFLKYSPDKDELTPWIGGPVADAKEAPHAICLAALKAVEESK